MSHPWSRRALPPRKSKQSRPVYSSKQTFSPSCTPHNRPLPLASRRSSTRTQREIVTFARGARYILTYKSIRRIRIHRAPRRVPHIRRITLCFRAKASYFTATVNAGKPERIYAQKSGYFTNVGACSGGAHTRRLSKKQYMGRCRSCYNLR